MTGRKLKRIEAGDVISYIDLCQEEGANLQRGMNFHLHGGPSVILMSLRHNAPYNDQISEQGKVLVYEGHDAPKIKGGPEPKSIDQPLLQPSGLKTQNGLLLAAAKQYVANSQKIEFVKVYEKIHAGIWVYNGLFKLVNAWLEQQGARKVCKFRLELVTKRNSTVIRNDIQHNRLIPSHVKLDVWKRDHGRCVLCGSSDNLHFDHDIPFSKGGASLVTENIRLLCAKHNLAKRDKIE
jgi:hypothetical protein